MHISHTYTQINSYVNTHIHTHAHTYTHICKHAETNEVTANRETCKSVENLCAPYYMATSLRRKANKYEFQNGMTNVFFKEYSGG